VRDLRLVNSLPDVAGRSTELLPISIEEDDPPLEGSTLPLKFSNMLVCTSGQDTRCLIEHPTRFLLASPDLSNPGMAVVKTSAPLQFITPRIENAKPRILEIWLQVYASPGQAAPCGAPDSNGKQSYTVELQFNDARSCDAALRQLDRTRAHARRAMLMQLKHFLRGSIPPSQENSVHAI